MTNEVNVQAVGERIEYIESLNARGVGTAVESQQFELACLHRLLAALTAKPVKLPESFYGVIQDGKVVMLPADDGQWLNKTSVTEAFWGLEQEKEAAEVEKAGAEERCRMMFDAKNHWADRARAAEAKLFPDGWKLVPVEPDWEMLSADGCKEHHNGQPCLHHDNRKRIWSAMLAAAPSPHE